MTGMLPLEFNAPALREQAPAHEPERLEDRRRAPQAGAIPGAPRHAVGGVSDPPQEAGKI